MTKQKELVIITIFALLLLGFVVFNHYRIVFPTPVQIDVEGRPTLGSPDAPVHLVVFEEPRCNRCKKFWVEVFPKIKEMFIDSGDVKLTVIPVSFMPDSLVATEALMCISEQDDLYFYGFIDHLYKEQPSQDSDWTDIGIWEEIAKQVGQNVDVDRVKQCISGQNLRKAVEDNTAYARKLMGGKITTPVVYVNGLIVNDPTFPQIRIFINRELKERK
ncbi:MAG: thioredoxin domain-containing protein [Chlamydiia bacterium]|nr:thioredoxin domain-containing protein [Chlamydiia bacterium]